MDAFEKLDKILIWQAFANAKRDWYIFVDEFFREEFPKVKRKEVI